MKKIKFLSFLLLLTSCTPTMQLMPVDLDVAADLPLEFALGWLQKTPKDMAGAVTPAYPLPCKFSDEGVTTTEWESALRNIKGKDNPVRPWKNFIARPVGNGLSSYTEYSINIYNSETAYQVCVGRVGLISNDGDESCIAYFTNQFKNDIVSTNCKIVKRDVERTLTALKAMGAEVVPQAETK